MKTRKMPLAAAVALALGILTACGGSGSEPQETDSPESAQETPTAEPAEMNPEKMTGSLNQEQTMAFVEYAAEQNEIDVCEHVTAALDPDDLDGFANLVMDRGGGYTQGIEKLSTMGVSVYARDACDY